MHCPECGEELNSGNVFCPKCGTEIQIVPDYDPLDELYLEGQDKTEKKPQKEEDKETSGKTAEKRSGKKEKNGKTERDPVTIRLIVTCAALFVILIGMIVGYFLYSSRNNYAYCMNQAFVSMEAGEYEEAILRMKRAEGMVKDNEQHAEVLRYLAKASLELGDKEASEGYLTEALSYAEDVEVREQIYYSIFMLIGGTERASEINGMIEAVTPLSLKTQMEDWRISAPICTMNGGTYSYYVYPKLEAAYGEIYYTLDGSLPDTESIHFDGRVELMEGDNLLTAVAINAYGIVSEPIYVVFTINLE